MDSTMKELIPQHMSVKEALLARKNDRLTTFLLARDQVRAVFLNCPHLVRTMAFRHQVGLLETLILGQALVAGLLVGSTLKGDDRVALRLEGDGPAGGFSVEANGHGEVRGMLKNPSFGITQAPQTLDTHPLIGQGYLSVIRFPAGARQPYTGQITFTHGHLARILTRYFDISEQTPTAFHLSVRFTPQGEVAAAGGLMIQGLPGADPETLTRLHGQVEHLPPLGETLLLGTSAEAFMDQAFGGDSPRKLSSRRVAFFCPCTPEGLMTTLRRLDRETRKDIVEKGPHPLKILCHYCGSEYTFPREELVNLLEDPV